MCKRIVVAGAGGFIGGHLTKHLTDLGHTVRAVDKKPIPQWYQRCPEADNLCLDLSVPDHCHAVCASADEVYQLAADMGGMGFIERFRIECMRSILINTHMIEAAYRAGVERYFFSSSACVYNTDLQRRSDAVVPLKEQDAYPALAERGYGWEKLFAEMLCQEYWAERRFPAYIARFHNVYGPHGSWCDGREKAPAAICRKVLEIADAYGSSDCGTIQIWGDGRQTRSYMHVKDCIRGILDIAHCDDLVATPINLGRNELTSVDELVTIAEQLAGVTLYRQYDFDAPKGVGGRNSDNTMIRDMLGWEPEISIHEGLRDTFYWIREQMGIAS